LYSGSTFFFSVPKKKLEKTYQKKELIFEGKDKKKVKIAGLCPQKVKEHKKCERRSTKGA
jgi:hypothetical protein